MPRQPENAKVIAVREFPRRLLRAKQYRDLTKESETSWASIADQLGKSPSVMSELKTGKRAPTPEEGVIFAEFFGVRPEWLLLDSGPMTESERQGEIVEPIVGRRPEKGRQGRRA